MVKVKDTASFIHRAIERHGNRYDYSKTVWVGTNKPIVILCRKCGPVTVSEAFAHYSKRGCGCGKCNYAAHVQKRFGKQPCFGLKKEKRQSVKKWSEKAAEVWGDRYDYSSSEYTGANLPISITCRKHGEFTLTTAGSHINTNRKECPKCTLLAESCVKRFKRSDNASRKVRNESNWVRWADVKVSLLTNRPTKIANENVKRKLTDWDLWLKVMFNERLRSVETKWQRKCRNWALGLVRRKQHERK